MKQLSQHFDSDMLSVTQHTDLLAQNRVEALQEPVVSRLTILAGLLEALLAEVLPNGFDVHDAYRGRTLNAAVNGVPTSQHCVGEAADIMPKGFENDLPLAMFKIAVWGLADPKKPRFGQLLIEAGCIHISLPRGHNDGNVAYWQPGNRIDWRPGV